MRNLQNTTISGQLILKTTISSGFCVKFHNFASTSDLKAFLKLNVYHLGYQHSATVAADTPFTPVLVSVNVPHLSLACAPVGVADSA